MKQLAHALKHERIIDRDGDIYLRKCVNSHADLCAALEAILESDKRGELHRDPMDTDKLFKQARAALAKARGEQV